MRRRFTRRALVGCLAVLFQLAAGLEAPFDLNLCIADDGHTVLEIGHAGGACRNEIERHHPGLASFDLEELAHHPCRDLSLRAGECGPGSSQPRLGQLASFVVASARVDLAGGATRVSHEGIASHSVGPMLRRTVVLLV